MYKAFTKASNFEERKVIIKAGAYVCIVESPDTQGEPFRQRDHYTNIILDIYALDDSPCDSCDIAWLNEEFENDKLKNIKDIDHEKNWGYTNIVQDSSGDLYAVTLVDSIIKSD